MPATIVQSPRIDMRISAAAGDARNPVSAEIAEGFDGLGSLREQWHRLFGARFNEPSTSFEWTSAMARHHVRSGDRCFLVTLRRDDTIVGLVPLVARTLRLARWNVVMLSPLSEDYNTHSDLLLQQCQLDMTLAFIDALFRIGVRWDCFRMARLLEDSAVSLQLQQSLAYSSHLHHVRDGLPAYELPLPTSFEAYLAERSAKFRNHLKRCERRLRDAGELRIHELGTPDEFDRAYEAMLTIERASWKHVHGTGISAVPRQVGFYRDFARSAVESGRLHLHWLSIDGRPAAYNLGHLHDGRYHYLKTSYDHSLRPLSPSTYLRARLIEGLIARRISHFDFPGEPYEWETQWTSAVRWRKVVTVYAPTIRGRMLWMLDGLRRRRKRTRVVEHIDAWSMARRERRTQ